MSDEWRRLAAALRESERRLAESERHREALWSVVSGVAAFIAPLAEALGVRAEHDERIDALVKRVVTAAMEATPPSLKPDPCEAHGKPFCDCDQ